MYYVNNFVQEFSEQWRSLALARRRVQHAVDVAIRNAEEIDIDVNKWLEDAKKALAVYGLQDAVDVATKNAEEIEIDVHKWLEDAKNEMEGENRLEKKRSKKKVKKFKLSKALEKKTETLRKLEEEGKKFQKVAHKAPLQDIEFLPSKELTPSESSKEAFEQIIKALKDDNINMIGLYGMGGVGKTTLVKEVGRRAKETQLIDEVLLATVSQNPNVKNIQDRMAESLGLQFDVKTKEGRADLLWQRLKTEKKLLVILDDVWQDVNLKEIGIPFGDDHRGCKVLLTTRLRGICFHMQCQQQVLLSILSENEAWALFKINAGLRDEDSNLNTVAEEVARECQGLPIALVTVGRALRDKSTVEWEVASKQLKNSQFQHMEVIGEQKNIYSCLKVSYDCLKHEKTKLCFLLCCLFPEDYDIPIEDLTRYAVGYGLHQDVESIEDARKEVYVAIKTLKDCCMLLGTETEEKVKMHDLVRDVAIQIASSKEHGFMVKAGIGLKEWPRSNKSFEGCTTISLMGNELAELPEGLACPQLKVLLLELGEYLNVPARFFEGMEEIEVLSLKGGCLSLQSLEFSTNLKSLLLIDCECNDLIWLRKLQRLEILCFIGSSSLEELPDEIGELKELRLLEVTGCKSPIKIPVNLIGRLKKLEELLIGGYSFKGWDAVGCDSIEGTNAGLTELNSLSHLAVLSLKIPRVECIPRDFVFPRLLKYDIVLGDVYTNAGHPTSTRLYLNRISAASLNAKTFEQLFPTVSQICFIDVEDLENIALSCDQMTSHGHGSQKDFLQRLEDVKVKGCRDTRTLFPAKWRQALNNLTRVEIEDCESLEEVFELGEAGEGINEEKELWLLSSLTRLELKLLPELKCIWKGPTRHVSLRSLVHLELQFLDKLTFIFTLSLAQSLDHLETLRIDYCSGLKHLIGEEKDDEREIIPESLGFPKLKTLSIRGCDQLEYVFPVSVSPSLLNLEEMDIEFGDNLKQIFYSGEGDALTRDGIINFPLLRELSLSRCDFCGPKNFTAQLPSLQVLAIEGHEELGDFLAQLQDFLQRLEDVKVKGCRDTRTLFPAKWRQALNNLTSVEIEDCKSLEEVFELGEAGEGINEEKELRLLSSLTRLRLSRLPELKCIWKGPTRHVSLRSLVHLELRSLHKLTFIFTPHLAQSLVHLETLQIEYCSGLKHLIREKDDEREIIPESLGFPKLKTLSISGCHKLEYVFPVSVSPSLLNLEEMTIVSDANLKQIFYSGEGDALTRDGIINIPQLRKFTLSNCCSFFGPRNFTAQLPSLQVLAIEGHEELGDLLAQLQLTNLRDIYITSSKGAQHLMQAGSFVPNRRTGHEWWQALKNLETMKIEDCESLEEVFELGEAGEGINEEKELLRLLSSLTRLELKWLPELKCIWKGPTRHVSLRSLVHLELQFLDKLTFIFTLSLAQSLDHLETLRIDYCSGLKHLIGEEKDDEREIIPESLGFPKLKTLSIRGCDQLEYVFPVSVSPSLLNLEVMRIGFGDNLKQIFYSGEGDALTRDGIINFPQLRELSLSSGCNVFGPKHFTAQFPSLQVLSIDGHEELGDLLAQLQGHTNLREIHITDCKGAQELMQVGRTGHELSLLSLEKLDLESLPDMRCIWKGLVLSHLTTLEVYDCQKLTHVFTGSMVASLVQLQSLDISGCSELEQIIAKDNDDEKDQILSGSELQSLCFPNLRKVEIDGCNKLRSLFPVAMASGLPKLKTLEVRDSSQLLGVFGQDDEASPVNVEKQMVLPNLYFLRLKNLPSIVCFSLGCDDFLFPCLEDLTVDECPKLTTQFANETNVSMSAQSEVSQTSSLKWLLRAN
ncbi:disease resistance protein [Salix suchowensis]|nr:disease resistance protein [Salix suchowensis]